MYIYIYLCIDRYTNGTNANMMLIIQNNNDNDTLNNTNDHHTNNNDRAEQVAVSLFQFPLFVLCFMAEPSETRI